MADCTQMCNGALFMLKRLIFFNYFCFTWVYTHNFCGFFELSVFRFLRVSCVWRYMSSTFTSAIVHSSRISYISLWYSPRFHTIVHPYLAVIVNPCAVGTPQGQCSTANLGACGVNYYCHVGATAPTTVCCAKTGERGWRFYVSIFGGWLPFLFPSLGFGFLMVCINFWRMCSWKVEQVMRKFSDEI